MKRGVVTEAQLKRLESNLFQAVVRIERWAKVTQEFADTLAEIKREAARRSPKGGEHGE